MKKSNLLLIAAATALGLSSLPAAVFVIYDGGAIVVDSSQTSGTYSSDAGVGNPASSLRFSGVNGNSVLFASSNPSFFLTPNDVDFSGTSVVSFDYLIPNGSSNIKLSDVRLKVVFPTTNITSTVIDVLGPNGQGLTADGNWHTLSFGAAEGSEFAWRAGFTRLFGTGVNQIDPSVPQQFYFQVSAGDVGLDIHIDNVTVAVVSKGGFDFLLPMQDGWNYLFALDNFVYLPSNGVNAEGGSFGYIIRDPAVDTLVNGIPLEEGVLPASGWADTQTWLGWLFVGDGGWVYSNDLAIWIWMPASLAGESGAWVYFLRP